MAARSRATPLVDRLRRFVDGEGRRRVGAAGLQAQVDVGVDGAAEGRQGGGQLPQLDDRVAPCGDCGFGRLGGQVVHTAPGVRPRRPQPLGRLGTAHQLERRLVVHPLSAPDEVGDAAVEGVMLPARPRHLADDEPQQQDDGQRDAADQRDQPPVDAVAVLVAGHGGRGGGRGGRRGGGRGCRLLGRGGRRGGSGGGFGGRCLCGRGLHRGLDRGVGGRQLVVVGPAGAERQTRGEGRGEDERGPTTSVRHGHGGRVPTARPPTRSVSPEARIRSLRVRPKGSVDQS